MRLDLVHTLGQGVYQDRFNPTSVTPGLKPNRVQGLCVSHGRVWVVGTDTRSADAWDLAAGTLVQRIATKAGEALHVAQSPDGALLAVMGQQASCWDVASATRHLDLGKSKGATGLAFAPDGLAIVAADLDKATIYHTAGGGVLARCHPPAKKVQLSGIGLSPDGARVYGVVAYTDPRVCAWDRSGVLVASATTAGGGSLAVAASGEVITADPTGLQVWDAGLADSAPFDGPAEEHALIGFVTDGVLATWRLPNHPAWYAGTDKVLDTTLDLWDVPARRWIGSSDLLRGQVPGSGRAAGAGVCAVATVDRVHVLKLA